MRLTKKLLSLIHQVFRKDPDQFIALRLRYSTGHMTWRVQDAVLTTSVNGGPGQNLTIDLTQFTIAQLVSHLAAQPGYSVVYIDGSDLIGLSARVLLDAEGDIETSNGDALYGYTNVLFAYLEAFAVELAAAEAQVKEMVRQMSTRTAGDVWLDELGGYYGVPRLRGEQDGSYGPRIIAEVLRPRGNNVAIEDAIKTFTGQYAKVTDVVVYGIATPAYNGTITHNGARQYNATAKPQYGLFDVEYGYDLINGGSITEFAQIVRDLIGRLRDAGTHLRALTLTGSAMADAYEAAPTDGSSTQDLAVTVGLSDALTAPSEAFANAVALGAMADAMLEPADAMSMGVAYSTTYNGARTYNGMVLHASGSTVSETL